MILIHFRRTGSDSSVALHDEAKTFASDAAALLVWGDEELIEIEVVRLNHQRYDTDCLVRSLDDQELLLRKPANVQCASIGFAPLLHLFDISTEGGFLHAIRERRIPWFGEA